jgi:hypothetical protein
VNGHLPSSSSSIRTSARPCFISVCPTSVATKPRGNYQAALTTEIQRHLEADPQLLLTLHTDSDDGTPPGRTAAPAPSVPPIASPGTGNRNGRHPDYGLLNEENRRRGAQGESLVADYERDWLRHHG